MLLLPLLVATIVVPTFAAHADNAVRGLKLAFAWMGAVALVYWLLVIFATPSA